MKQLPNYYDDLDLTLKEILGLMERAVKDRKSGFHNFVVATSSFDNMPDARIVVLRGFDSKKMEISFHSDLRSQKVNQLNNNKYHAIATNLYLRGVTNSTIGRKQRKNVDLVFTSGYVHDLKYKFERNIVTFNGVADYGIYCFTFTQNKITHITLTFSTNEFDVDKLSNILEKDKDKNDFITL